MHDTADYMLCAVVAMLPLLPSVMFDMYDVFCALFVMEEFGFA